MLDDTTNDTTPKVTNPHASLDLTKSTVVIIRRSGRCLEPSLFVQEQLVAFAKLVRGEDTDEHIILYQDGTPTTDLLEAITNGLVGSIIAERPDRLLRNEHTRAIPLLRKQHITVIVPGKRVYDLNNEEDLKAFQWDTQDAYDYIASHIKYMKASRYQRRGRRGGSTTTALPSQQLDTERE